MKCFIVKLSRDERQHAPMVTEGDIVVMLILSGLKVTKSFPTQCYTKMLVCTKSTGALFLCYLYLVEIEEI